VTAKPSPQSSPPPSAPATASPVAASPTASAFDLESPVEVLDHVGQTRARDFRRIGLNKLGDLLEYFPRDYVFESAEGSIADLKADQIHTVRGEVVAADYLSGGRRSRFEATLSDGTGKLAMVWFNSAWLRTKLHPGQNVRVRGRVKFFRNLPQMANPKWELIDAEDKVEPLTAEKLRPIYAATAGLSSEFLGSIIDANLNAASSHVEEFYDRALLDKRYLIGRADAYRLIHRPANLLDAKQARRRLVFDELMLMQLGLGLSRRLRDGRVTAPVMRIDKLLDERIRARFPFTLTKAQQNSIWQIGHDLRSGHPMNRLLQGDVGSGKTVVALYAMLVAIANKMQAAILAPTEVLAEQHFLTLSRLLEGSSVHVELFTNRTKRESKGKLPKMLARGEVHLAVGTQALIQQDIEFANLGLVVVDEQHKLGVRQRAVLKSKGYSPHYLVMTATPIPRSLALSYFADFDLSMIDELPPGRVPIVTRWLRPEKSPQAYDFIRKQVKSGRQAYLVVPKIDDDGLEESKSVRVEFDRLSKGPLKGVRLAMLHGQMTTEEKQSTMAAFRAGKVDVLVATTVIEVGIDVPNATVMLIDNAERFGLSQLHQLRGRVGRGSEESYCLLISPGTTDNAQERLRAMTHTSDGFEIAEMDLKLRGPGEFFGTRQHGLPQMRLADITTELDLLAQAKNDALAILKADPKLSSGIHRPLREALIRQFGDALQLAQVG
jgi:ATP-dependent DNA helicase RecG